MINSNTHACAEVSTSIRRRIGTLLADATRLYQAGSWNKAAQLYQQILALDPWHSDSLHRLGVIAARGGDHGRAADMIRRAITQEPHVGAYHLDLGRVLHENGRLDEAVVSYRAALVHQPDLVEAHANLGTALEEAGELEKAIYHHRAAIELKPNVAEFHYNLGNTLRRSNQLDQAVACHCRAIELKPEFAEAYFNLGNILREQSKLEEAIICHRRAIALKPDSAEAYTNLGSELEQIGQIDEALDCYRKVVLLKPSFAPGYSNLGSALLAKGRADEVVACFRRAIALQPDYAEAYNNLGNILQDCGQLDEAYHAYKKATELAPRRATFHRMLANTGRVGAGSEALRRMEEFAADMSSLPPEEQMELHFALATVYGAGEKYQQAFGHLLQGNALKRSMTSYHETQTLAVFQHIRRIFSAELLATKQNCGRRSQLPVFVVGMPRSGTTLVEQILASHPEIFGAGELPHLPHLVGGLVPMYGAETMSEGLAALPEERWKQLGDAYLSAIQKTAPAALRVVDKLPDNFMRIGLIRMALPDAKIIHVHRDPVDTCMSCFSILFTGHLPYTYDLGELGRFYRGYDTVMRHWRQVLPDNAILDVSYEALVTDFEPQARRIVDYCGLPWDENCSDFHKTPRPIRTASVKQVRQPLYKSSVGRWDVYRDMARPLIDALTTKNDLSDGVL